MEIRTNNSCDSRRALGVLTPLYNLGRREVSAEALGKTLNFSSRHEANAGRVAAEAGSVVSRTTRVLGAIGRAGGALVDVTTGVLGVANGIQQDIDAECKVGRRTIAAIVRSTAQISGGSVAGTLAGSAALALLAPAGAVVAAGTGAVIGAALVGTAVAGVVGYGIGKACDAVLN